MRLTGSDVHYSSGLGPFALSMVVLAMAGCSSRPALASRSNLLKESAVILAQLTADVAGGREFMIAPTGSMKPTLDENSVVTVEAVCFDQLRSGDIVIYRNISGAPVVHRLYEKAGGCWFVLGENNARVDREAVPGANLLGRVCAIFYTSSGSRAAAQTTLAQR
jgi:signal peptidase I